MREIRTKSAYGRGAFHGVAVDAGERFKCRSSVLELGHIPGWFALLRSPFLKITLLLRNHSKQHVGVLGTAIFGTIAQIDPGLARIDPQEIIAIWNQIRF